MQGAGTALMGIGAARGDDRAVEAAERAIASPLLEAGIDGAHGVLLSVSGGSDLGLFEINESARLVADAAHPDANIIFGAVIDDTLGDEVRVTVIAAGFEGGQLPTRAAEARSAESGARKPDTRSSIEPPTSRSRPERKPESDHLESLDLPDFLRDRRSSQDAGDRRRPSQDMDGLGNGAEDGAPALDVPDRRDQPRRKIVFDDTDDDLDIPDFLK
jgi:cell division protein FtsZ